VDFVLRNGKQLLLIEVKSTRRQTSLPGISAFIKNFGHHRSLPVGAQGIPLQEFLLMKNRRFVLTAFKAILSQRLFFFE
jgi:hypothetical protein